MILFAIKLLAQPEQTIYGKVFDAVSKEPLQSAIVSDSRKHSVMTDANGRFQIHTTDKTLMVRHTGFEMAQLAVNGNTNIYVALIPSPKELQQVVVSANRTSEKRSEAPIAIGVISKQTMEDTKANRLDQLLNKISGVFMVNLGNEQHEMSIRQPMTTKSLFLYMEDGVPIRTSGIYNHNALLEMNMTAARSIEVIRGPASALYGAEAIAGAVNIITQSSPAFSNGSVSTQINNNGYKRVDIQAGTSMNKWGFLASGYYANRTNGPVDYSNFHKTAFSLRSDYRPDSRTSWSNTLSYVDYYSNMTGALDSLKFAQRNYSTPHSFTFRSVYALRFKSMFKKQWNQKSESAITALYRNNSIDQNPSYSVGSTANPLLFRGQINKNAFQTYAFFAQHTQKFNWLNSKLIAGASLDISPQSYNAHFIWIQKNSVTGKYSDYYSPSPDSLLSNYQTGIGNLASFIDLEINPWKRFKIVAAIRYDAFRYDFRNHLPVSASSGAPSTINSFSRLTPKIGFTYNRNGIGFYGNYSEGYVPPQITELFNSTKVPYLQPQTFFNFEVGGWLSVLQNKLYIDWSLYRMDGRNEIISVKQPDGTTINENAGRTRHTGIEYGIHYRPDKSWMIRVSATNAHHQFIENVVKGINYNGKEMSAAPRFTSNMEVTYKPSYIPGLRLSAEWQHQSGYFLDDLNLYRYRGFDLANLRAGYTFKDVEIWINVLNAGNLYYSGFASKSAASGSASYSYNLGDPREITLGICYTFRNKR